MFRTIITTQYGSSILKYVESAQFPSQASPFRHVWDGGCINLSILRCHQTWFAGKFHHGLCFQLLNSIYKVLKFIATFDNIGLLVRQQAGTYQAPILASRRSVVPIETTWNTGEFAIFWVTLAFCFKFVLLVLNAGNEGMIPVITSNNHPIPPVPSIP